MDVSTASGLYHSLRPYFEGIMFILSNLPKQRTVTFRGLTSQPSSMSKGNGLTLHSFTSTSVNKQVAEGFTGPSSDSSMNVLQVCSGVSIRFVAKYIGED
eukprot:PhF_6_TR8741/c1_g1_i3/m.13756